MFFTELGEVITIDNFYISPIIDISQEDSIPDLYIDDEWRNEYVVHEKGEYVLDFEFVNDSLPISKNFFRRENNDYSPFYYLTSVSDNFFSGCIELPNMYGAHLNRLVIPNTFTTIRDSELNSLKELTEIIFEENSQLTSIGEWTFADCSNLSSVTISNSVTSIGNGAFYNCPSLSEVIFEENSQLTSIGNQAFDYCSSLTSITIPSGVTSIEGSAFANCSSLTSITCLAITAPTVKSYTFTTIASNGTLYYPSGSDYSTWKSYLPSSWTFVEI